MKKRTIISILAVMLVLLSALLSGCGMVKMDITKDMKQVVATVGEKEILKSAFLSYYNSQLQTALYYSQMGGPSYDETTEEGKKNIEKLKTDCLEALIKNEFIVQQAEKGGFMKLTDEEKKAVEKELNDQIAGYVDQIVANIKKDHVGKTDAEIRKIATEQYWTEQGYTTELALENSYIQKGISKYKETLSKDVTVTQTEIVNKYNSLKEEQKKSFDASYAAFEQAFNDDEAVAYNLKGYITVQSLLIKITDEEKKELDELTAKDPKDTAIKTKRAAALKKIEQKAKDVLAKVQAKDADFTKLVEEYGEDPGMKEKEIRDKGYLVGENTTAYVSEFKKAALELKKVGDTTELVESNYGYFIIKKISEIPAGEVAMDKIKDKIEEDVLAAKKVEKQDAEIDKVFKVADIKRYPKRLKIYEYTDEDVKYYYDNN